MSGEWIPVTERLPEVDDVCLCFAEGQSRPFLASFSEDGWQSLDVYDYDRDGECTAENPTHWMPLPAPPTDAK